MNFFGRKSKAEKNILGEINFQGQTSLTYVGEGLTLNLDCERLFGDEESIQIIVRNPVTCPPSDRKTAFQFRNALRNIEILLRLRGMSVLWVSSSGATWPPCR